MRSHGRSLPGTARVIQKAPATGRAQMLLIQLFNFPEPSEHHLLTVLHVRVDTWTVRMSGSSLF